jgi:putative tryptophan/tyrosine transport system substrate-binding protein
LLQALIGGNVTGATFFSNLLSAKRLDLFHRMIPKDNIIALLLNPKNANVELEKHQTQEAARPLDLQIIILQAGDESEINEALGSLRSQGATALIVSGDTIFNDRRAQIAELAMRYKIPTSCPYRDQAAAGCLMSYGADISVTFREAGNYVGRILKGEKPANLPVLQPTKFELVINLRTAKAFGLDVPSELLATADAVIE